MIALSAIGWGAIGWASMAASVVVGGFAWLTRHGDDPMSDTDRWCSAVDEDLDRIARTR
jgi:hypothetical protein